MKLYALKTLHEEKPISIDQTPYFSWKIESMEADTMQTSYQVVVTLLSKEKKTVWNSGKIESDQSVFVVYEGEKLLSNQEYMWEVSVWDNHGNVASETSFFETGIVDETDWKAKWVCSKPQKKRKNGFGNQPAPLLFRREFILSKKTIKKAKLLATSHGMYNLSINGVRPDDRHFAPEYSSYDSILFYQSYDVTHLLKSGKNALGIYVGDGWYFCPKTTMTKKNAKDGYGILFQLEIIYDDGSRDMIFSDGSEKYSTGPILFSDLFSGEKYDANLEIKGWDTADFDDSNWHTVIFDKKSGYQELASQYGKPVKVAKEVPGDRFYISPKGEMIIDFGQVLAGKVRMRVHAPKGTEITIDHFETPDLEGNYFNNILSEGGVGGGCEQRVVYISNGEEKEYTEYFSYQGFRYIRVSGLDQVDIKDFTALALSSQKENLGTFTCSDDRLNRLYENTRWSQSANMISIPTDCPQREKAGWTGDIGLYAPTAFLNEDVTDILTRWLRSLSFEQATNGAVPMVIPNNQTYKSMMTLLKLAGKRSMKGNIGIAGWSDACILVPLAMYKQTGNVEVLRANYDGMKKWCGYIIEAAKTMVGNKYRPKEIEKYLWDTGFHFGEWLIPSDTEGGMSDKSSMEKALKKGVLYVPEIYAILAMRNLSYIADALDKEEDCIYYKDMEMKMTDAFAKGCITPEGHMLADNMGAYIMAVYYDIVPENLRKSFEDIIVEKIKNNNMRLDTGFLGTPIILDTLCKIGRTDIAYEMLFQTEAPSWLYEVENGATTIWESWHTKNPDGSPMAVSLNHYAFGCVDDWMFRNIVGIVPMSPGFKTFKIAPVIDERITFAKRTYETEYGKISVEWKKENEEFLMDVIVPCNTTATIVLPDGECHECGSGFYHFSCCL